MPGSYPQLSNVYPELKATLDKRAGNNSPWNSATNPGVSGLSTWIRLISAAAPKGLILESINPKSTSFQARYGGKSNEYTGPGIIGRNWDGAIIRVPGVSRAYRPSPIITAMSMDENAEGGSRTATISIRAFTKEQSDILATYFLEPGFHCLCEWGWNTQKSKSQMVAGGGNITVCDLVAYDQWSTVREKRLNSEYTYDAFLGIVAGGGIEFGDDESYSLNVKLIAIGNVAEYMQTHRGANETTENNDGNNSGMTFNTREIAYAVNNTKIGQALFMQMFNQLPGQKRTKDVYDLYLNPKWADSANFVNMDEKVGEILKSAVSEGAELKTSSGKDAAIPNETPFLSEEKFIRFELACEIINKYPFELERKGSSCSNYETRGNLITIKNTVISGFPHMFSTDATKLFIPNPTAPNFKFVEALSATEEITSYIDFLNLNKEANIANLHPIAELTDYPWLQHLHSRKDPGSGNHRPVPYAFPNTAGIYLKSLADDTFIPLQEKAGFWGYLKDLYINFNFFVECISKSNLVVRDVFYEMLNGMSGACNSIWKFQIMEGILDKPSGKYELMVKDVNFLGDISNNEGITTFQSRGVKSPFISCDFTVEIPGAMVSSVAINKLKDDKTGPEDGRTFDNAPELNPRPMLGSVFSRREDLVGTVLAGIQQAKKAEEEKRKAAEAQKQSGQLKQDFSNSPPKEKTTSELEKEAKIANFEFFTKTAAVLPKLADRNGKLDVTKTLFDRAGNDNTIEGVLMIGAWSDTSALRQCFLIDKGLAGNTTSQQIAANNTKNPPFGGAEFNFKVHGVSGFKLGDQMQIDGLPDKFGAPNVFQVVKIDHTLDGMLWTTDVKTKLRIVGSEATEDKPE
jgi:hypothetical protein